MARSVTRTKGQTIFSLIAQKQANLPPDRPAPGTSGERKTYQNQIRTEICNLLHFQKSDQPLDVRPTVTTPREGYRIEKVQFLSEPGIYIPAWVYVPDGKTGVLPTILYVNDEGYGSRWDGRQGRGEHRD